MNYSEYYFTLKMATRIITGIVLVVTIICSTCVYTNNQFIAGGYIECPLRGSQHTIWVKPGGCE